MSIRLSPLVAILAILIISVTGCSEDPVANPVVEKGFILTAVDLPVSEAGDTYALWLAFPAPAARQKRPATLHGTYAYRLVTPFKVASDGSIVILGDTTDLERKLNANLRLAAHALISLEKEGAIAQEPLTPIAAGDLKGTAELGHATLTRFHEDVANIDSAALSGTYTLAAAPGSPSDQYEEELYLMDALSTAEHGPGITGLGELEGHIRLASWVRTTLSGKDTSIYLGSFAIAAGFDFPRDSDSYPYPGGRVTGADLTTGTSQFMITLDSPEIRERPKLRQALTILSATIPQGVAPFAAQPMQIVSQPFAIEIKLKR